MKRVKKTAVADRRKKVAELALMGLTQETIARRLGVNQSTVGRDLEQVRRDWRDLAVRNFDEARGPRDDDQPREMAGSAAPDVARPGSAGGD